MQLLFLCTFPPPSGNSLSRRAEVTAAAAINPTYITSCHLCRHAWVFTGARVCQCPRVRLMHTHTHTHLWCDFPFLRVCLFIGSQTNGRMSVLMSPFGRTGDYKTQTPIHVLLIIFSGGVPWELVGGRQFAFIVPICTSNSWQSAGLLLICSLDQHFLRLDLFGAGLDIDTWVF